MTKAFNLGVDRLTCDLLSELSQQKNPKLEINATAKKRVQQFRKQVDAAIATKKTIYGINTGFGLLSDVRINDAQLSELQENLIRSHACGVGENLSEIEARALMILRLHTFCLGHSGVSLELVEFLKSLVEKNIIAAIPKKGSVGACGDLAPLSHLAIVLIGEGEVIFENKIQSTKDVFKKLKITALKLKSKEGLACINGTHFMTAVGSLAVREAKNILEASHVIAALSLDAFRGTLSAFDPRIHHVRPHKTQQYVAKIILDLFAGKDQIMDSHKNCGKVQDPYSFRCIPQVHGAALHALNFIEETLNVELNSITDNPLVFDNGDVISGGNFHGQFIAQAMDILAIAFADLGNISERRVEKLTNPAMSGLPAFLVKDAGLNSGFMIPHVTAAALASENKTLAHPSSVDTIPTSADKEDHVSMGPWAVLKARQVLENVARIVAIEALAAAQGVDLLKPLKPAPKLKIVYDEIRKKSAAMNKDRSLAKDIQIIADWISDGGVNTCLES